MIQETTALIQKDSSSSSGLNVFFATLCIVDIFGVFPIIALPRAIVQCGLLGIPLVLVVFFLQIYTAILLGKSWIMMSNLDPQISQKNRYPLAAVTELTMGPKMRTFITILLDLTVFGGGIPNLLVASQNLQLFGLKVSEQKFDISFCYWLLLIGVFLCPLMWLGSPRDMKWLATCSTVTVCLTALLIWWSIITDNRKLNVLPVPTSPTWDKFISGYGMLAFQFDVHPTLMTVQVDMRKPQNIDKAVILSFLISGTFFGITTGLSVWKYGGSTTENILQAVPPESLILAAILIAALQLCFSSSLGHSALFQHVESQLRVDRTFGWKRCATRSAIVCLAVAIAESVPRFDVVMSLIGGSLTGPLVFILPPLIYSQAKSLKSQKERRSFAPEIFSGTEEHIYNETPSNSNVHSKSVYFGFSDTDDQKNYSYVYYDREIHADEYSDFEDDQLFNDKRNKGNVQKSNDNLILLDASELRCYRRRSVRDSEIRKDYFILERLVDWFGYFIVTFGIVITVSSTYINVRNTVKYVSFTPPCIINSTVTMNLL